MKARLPRRLALGAAVAVAVPVLAGARGRDGDAALLEIAAGLRAAHARELETVRLLMVAETSRNARAAEAAAQAADEAFDARTELMERMAGIPARGLPGMAAKAALICRALEQEATAADRLLADSLLADVVRLVPAAVLT